MRNNFNVMQELHSRLTFRPGNHEKPTHINDSCFPCLTSGYELSWCCDLWELFQFAFWNMPGGQSVSRSKYQINPFCGKRWSLKSVLTSTFRQVWRLHNSYPCIIWTQKLISTSPYSAIQKGKKWAYFVFTTWYLKRRGIIESGKFCLQTLAIAGTSTRNENFSRAKIIPSG